MTCPLCENGPDRPQCTHCHGTGRVCGLCSGAGFHWRNPEHPPCADCDGTGRPT